MIAIAFCVSDLRMYAGAVPHLLHLLSSKKSRTVDQAVWALGNIAGKHVNSVSSLPALQLELHTVCTFISHMFAHTYIHMYVGVFNGIGSKRSSIIYALLIHDSVHMYACLCVRTCVYNALHECLLAALHSYFLNCSPQVMVLN